MRANLDKARGLASAYELALHSIVSEAGKDLYEEAVAMILAGARALKYTPEQIDGLLKAAAEDAHDPI